jgi:transposase
MFGRMCSPMLASPAPKTAYHPLEVLTRKGASQDEIAERLGLTVQEVAKVRQRLRLLNWVIVGAAYELVRRDGRPKFDQEYKRQILAAVAQKMALPGGAADRS